MIPTTMLAQTSPIATLLTLQIGDHYVDLALRVANLNAHYEHVE